MDKSDPHYDLEMKVLIFPEYNNNTFIDGQMVYVIGVDYKYM